MTSKDKLSVVLCIIIFGAAMGLSPELPALWQRVLLSSFGGAMLGVALVIATQRRRSA